MYEWMLEAPQYSLTDSLKIHFGHVLNTRKTELLRPGTVYVMERTGFQQSPAYQHPGLGFLQEAHWVNPDPVMPIMDVPVEPDDFPLPVHVHDDALVMQWASCHPREFPWLDEQEKES